MLYKTRGIALNYIKYRDTSIIARIYTQEFGKQSYIINGIRSKKSKASIGNFQPLSLLDLVVYKNEQKEIQRLSEHKNAFPFSSIPYDIRKSTIAIFLTEMLVKVLPENHHAEDEQFNFLFEAIKEFDQFEDSYESFHIHFLVHLTTFLGFGITDSTSLVEDGDEDMDTYFEQLIRSSEYVNVPTSRAVRKKALDLIIRFYNEHVDSLGKVKSLTVMNQVFD